MTLALNTGMHQGELLNLKWEAVNLAQGLITVRQSKTLRLKTIAINAPAKDALDWLGENRYGEYLFMWPWGDKIGKVTVYDAFKKPVPRQRSLIFAFTTCAIPLRLI